MTTPTIEYRTVDKAEWGPGPWQSEPDKRQWADPETGLPCLIVRGPSGALCGYVGVDPAHPAHGKNYDFWRYGEELAANPLTPVEEAINALDAHGGLTFAGGCGHGADPSQGICHIPAEGEADSVWWFGFDCAHCDDLTPAYALRYGSPASRDVYRDQPYVEAQVANLAKQLAGMPSVARERSDTGHRDRSSPCSGTPPETLTAKDPK